MTETVEAADTLPSEIPTAPGPGKGRNPNSLRNLRPFAPGQSGNPSGLTKDGKSPRARALEASLLERLERPGTMDKIAARWLNLALKGSYPHLNAILERLYPVPQDVASKRVVLEGLTLEMTPGGGAKATLLRAEGQGAGELPPAESFAESERPESRVGGHETVTPIVGVSSCVGTPREVEVLSRGSEGGGKAAREVLLTSEALPSKQGEEKARAADGLLGA